MIMEAALAQADIPVNWPTINYVVGILIAVIAASGGAAGWGVHKLLGLLTENQDYCRKYVTDALIGLNDQLNDHAMRVRALESFNSGIVVMMREINSFRGEVKEDFKALRDERKEDMNNLHRRLDTFPTKDRSDG